MSGIPMIIMEMLGWAGIALGNYAVATLPQWMSGEDWMRNTITGVALGVVVNLGSLLYLMLVALIKRSGVSLELVSAVVDAAEEQFGKGTGKGTEKLDYAMSLIEQRLKQYRLGFFATIGFRLFSRPLVSMLAPRIKVLLYSQR